MTRFRQFLNTTYAVITFSSEDSPKLIDRGFQHWVNFLSVLGVFAAVFIAYKAGVRSDGVCRP